MSGRKGHWNWRVSIITFENPFSFQILRSDFILYHCFRPKIIYVCNIYVCLVTNIINIQMMTRTKICNIYIYLYQEEHTVLHIVQWLRQYNPKRFKYNWIKHENPFCKILTKLFETRCAEKSSTWLLSIYCFHNADWWRNWSVWIHWSTDKCVIQNY